MPAIIALSVGIVRLNLLAGRSYSRSTNLLLREALEPAADDATMDIYALKIVNIGDLASDGAPLGQFIERVIAIVQSLPLSGETGTQIAFERDTLVWQAPRSSGKETDENSKSLVALLLSGHPLAGGQRIEGTLAIDTNRTLPFQMRVHNAMHAAELGSRKRLRTIVADTSWLGVRERRLSLLEDLDNAIAAKAIGVGYQPKIDFPDRQGRGSRGAPAMGASRTGFSWTQPR